MSDLIITLEIADIICQMEEVCWGEGIGPMNIELMDAIFSKYPELKKKYSYMIKDN